MQSVKLNKKNYKVIFSNSNNNNRRMKKIEWKNRVRNTISNKRTRHLHEKSRKYV